MLKRFILFVICVVILSGCSIRPQKEEITFSSWGSITEVQILKQIISEFEEENPSIKVKFLHIPQNYFQKIHLLFASNTPPDVIFMNNLYLPIYAQFLQDLSSEIDSSDFYKQALDGLSYQGNVYAFPRDISNLVFYVNTDLVKLQQDDWTLDNLLKISQSVSDKEKLGLSFEEDLYWVLPYLAYFGEKFDRDFDSELSKGVRFYLDLRDKHKVAPSKSQIGSSTLAQMFLDEKIAIFLSGRWLYPKISEKAKFNWAVINFPYGEGLQPCDASGWSISKVSEHKNSALKFVKYLSSKNSAKYFAQTGLVVPARVEASKLLDNEEHNEKVFLDVIKHSKNTFVTKDYRKLVDKFNKTNFN